MAYGYIYIDPVPILCTWLSVKLPAINVCCVTRGVVHVTQYKIHQDLTITDHPSDNHGSSLLAIFEMLIYRGNPVWQTTNKGAREVWTASTIWPNQWIHQCGGVGQEMAISRLAKYDILPTRTYCRIIQKKGRNVSRCDTHKTTTNTTHNMRALALPHTMLSSWWIE